MNYSAFFLGGTMQTEEIVPRAQSTGIDSGPTGIPTGSLQHHLHHSSQIKCPLPPLLHMAVKQEPQDEEERSRDTNALRWAHGYDNRSSTLCSTFPLVEHLSRNYCRFVNRIDNFILFHFISLVNLKVTNNSFG